MLEEVSSTELLTIHISNTNFLLSLAPLSQARWGTSSVSTRAPPLRAGGQLATLMFTTLRLKNQGRGKEEQSQYRIKILCINIIYQSRCIVLYVK